MAAAIVNTDSEKTTACVAMAVRFAIMESGRTGVLNAIISLAPSRDALNMVANSPVCAL